MSGVMQTILASDPKRQGNCLSACVATWLDCSLDEVPHFAEYVPERKDAWWDCLIGFMAGRGFWAYEIDLSDAEPGEVVFAMGMSPRGVCHQVLYRDGALWHDPHPAGGGVTDVREVIRWRHALHDHTPTAPAPNRCVCDTPIPPGEVMCRDCHDWEQTYGDEWE